MNTNEPKKLQLSKTTLKHLGVRTNLKTGDTAGPSAYLTDGDKTACCVSLGSCKRMK